MRSLLQFLSAGTSAFCALLVMGALLTVAGRADENPEGGGANCHNCCLCDTDTKPKMCKVDAAVKGCTGYNCSVNCDCYLNETQNKWLCH